MLGPLWEPRTRSLLQVSERVSNETSFRQLVLVGISLLAAGLILAFWGYVSKWNLGESLGVVGLAVSIAGFSLAIWQLQKTQSAAATAFGAIHDTLRGVAASRLGVVIVQMRQAIQEYEEAIAANPQDLNKAKSALTRYRELGGDAETLIDRRFGGDSDALASLRESREIARITKARMFGVDQGPPDFQTCLERMEHTADALAPLLEQLWPAIKET